MLSKYTELSKDRSLYYSLNKNKANKYVSSYDIFIYSRNLDSTYQDEQKINTFYDMNMAQNAKNSMDEKTNTSILEDVNVE